VSRQRHPGWRAFHQFGWLAAICVAVAIQGPEVLTSLSARDYAYLAALFACLSLLSWVRAKQATEPRPPLREQWRILVTQLRGRSGSDTAAAPDPAEPATPSDGH